MQKWEMINYINKKHNYSKQWLNKKSDKEIYRIYIWSLNHSKGENNEK